jgi:Zn-dependent M28 family amino/carboxypeptidase
MGYIAGSAEPDRFTLLTAHYDHLGVRDGKTYPGADDDASGVATMLAAAAYFAHHQPHRSILFIAFDGEEEGLRGSAYFVAHPAVPLKAIALEVNLDMVARGDRNELVAAGTSYSPELKERVADAARGRHLTLVFGHDRPAAVAGGRGDAGKEDWTHSSDHGPFHDAGIPFLYFGVEDHPDYHRPTDTADKIPNAFFIEAANLIVDTLVAFDMP